MTVTRDGDEWRPPSCPCQGSQRPRCRLWSGAADGVQHERVGTRGKADAGDRHAFELDVNPMVINGVALAFVRRCRGDLGSRVRFYQRAAREERHGVEGIDRAPVEAQRVLCRRERQHCALAAQQGMEREIILVRRSILIVDRAGLQQVRGGHAGIGAEVGDQMLAGRDPRVRAVG